MHHKAKTNVRLKLFLLIDNLSHSNLKNLLFDTLCNSTRKPTWQREEKEDTVYKVFSTLCANQKRGAVFYSSILS